MTTYTLVVIGGHRLIHCEVFSELPTFDIYDVLIKNHGDQAWLVQANINGGDSVVLEEA